MLYHPTSAVARVPATGGMPFDPIEFAVDSAGHPQLHGWWIPYGQDSRYTVVYLHGSAGNLGDTVDSFIPFRAARLNIFAFDYRGYGMSRFEHPSEARMGEDAESAIAYLIGTRHIPASSLVLVGRDLGANLALQVAAAHPELAGVVLDNPLETPTAAIFNDPRARLVPARLLFRDKWDPNTPAANLLIPSLWFYRTIAAGMRQDEPLAYRTVTARKSLVWLIGSSDAQKQYYLALSRWLDDLQPKLSPQ